MPTYIPRPLIFVHIPKAAGTTLREIMAKQYAGGRSFEFTGDPAQRKAFLEQSVQQRGSYDLLQGHVQFGLHEYLPDPATYVTMLRDPVERVISHYHFILARKDHYLHDSLRKHGFSLQAWVARAPMVVDNYQVRWLIQRPMGEIAPGTVTRAMLEEAMWNLENAFTLVGITERFEESLICFERAFGWRDIHRAASESPAEADASGEEAPGVAPLRRNVNPDRPSMDQIDSETIETIRRVNRFDVELYEFALTLFEEQCRRYKVRPRPRAVSASSRALAPWKNAVSEGPPRFPERPVVLQAIPLACHGLGQIVILRQYRDRRQYRFNGHPAVAEKFREMPEKERRAIDILWGPLHYGLQRSIPGRQAKAAPAAFLTMLRDPVERIIAHYYFVIANPLHSLHRRVTSAGWSLYDYIANQTTLELDNDHIRWLNDIPHKQVPFGRVTREMLDRAKLVLEDSGTLFGLAEYLEETLLMFSLALGWKDVRFLDTGLRSRVPQAASIDPRTHDLIRQTNALDIELYEFARSIFEQRLALLGDPFQEKLQEYRLQNAALADNHNWSNQLGELTPEPSQGPAPSPRGEPGDGGAQSITVSRAAEKAMPDRDIIWIASYPRSGNSWLRFLLDTYFFPPARYMQEVGRLSGELDWWLSEAARLCHPQEWILTALRNAQAKYKRPDDCPDALFFKTHYARTAQHPLIERSRAAIHLIRDPRDVLLSGMNFSELTSDGEGTSGHDAETNGDLPDHQKERQYAQAFIQSRGDPTWLQTGYGDWVEHARSWIVPEDQPAAARADRPGGDFPILTVRYEDLKIKPEGQLQRILEFLGVAPDRHRIRAAVEHCSLARLRNLERASRIITDIKTLKRSGRYFFNKGLSGQSLAPLGEDIEASFHAAFGEEARALGY